MNCVLTFASSNLHEPVRQSSVLTHMMVLRIANTTPRRLPRVYDLLLGYPSSLGTHLPEIPRTRPRIRRQRQYHRSHTQTTAISRAQTLTYHHRTTFFLCSISNMLTEQSQMQSYKKGVGDCIGSGTLMTLIYHTMLQMP
eukprot:17755_5